MLRKITITALVLFMALVMVLDASATINHKKSLSVYNGKDSLGQSVKYQYTDVVVAWDKSNSSDTTAIYVRPPVASVGSTNPWNFVWCVRASGADSLPNWCVKYQVSPDGVDYYSYTVGTDSTTWTGANTTGWTVVQTLMATATYGGRWGYHRFLIFPKKQSSAQWNAPGNRFKFIINEQ